MTYTLPSLPERAIHSKAAALLSAAKERATVLSKLQGKSTGFAAMTMIRVIIIIGRRHRDSDDDERQSSCFVPPKTCYLRR